MKNNDKKNSGFKFVKEQPKTKNTYRILMLIILVVFITFLATSIGMYTYFKKSLATSSEISAFLGDSSNAESISEKLMQYRKLMDKYYIGDIDEKELEEGAIRGYVAALGDEYTQYIPAEDMQEYNENLRGNFVGIGVYMTQDKELNKVKVLTPIKNSVAQRVGILPNDIINAVDGVEYSGEQMDEVSQKIKGEEGTEVKLEIIRGEEKLNFTIVRENVKLNPVEGEVLENDIGYIAFTSFDEDTSEEFKDKYNELKEKNIKSLIIDLRNNGGGIVDKAVDIAGCILDKDSTVLYEIDKNNNKEEKKTTTDPIIDVPIVVLVNENSASTSEILVGALKDHKKATIVGKKTFGKGIIQSVLSLIDGSGLKITSEEYLTPNETKINKVGIEPDETVELPEDVKNVLQVERSKDTQLQKAIEILNK